MKKSLIILTAVSLCTSVLFFGCKKDKPETDLPVLKLTPDNVSGKSGFNVSTVLSGTVQNGVKNFYISKTINLKIDSSWGTNGILKVTTIADGQNTFEYPFSYTLQDNEVDKLVGFNYRIEDAKGKAAEKDLTVNTIASGAQIIASHPWKISSNLWETATPPEESLEECGKDDIWTFNRDSTMSVNYGASGCLFDGFNIFSKWTLSKDEKTFTRTYYSIFNPANITTEVYKVISLTKERMVLEIALDLSVFGLGEEELFKYTYDAY